MRILAQFCIMPMCGGFRGKRRVALLNNSNKLYKTQFTCTHCACDDEQRTGQRLMFMFMLNMLH